MGDEANRRLARELAARPEDVATSLAHARALGRQGDRRAELRALAALARGGCAEAQEALEQGSPWPGPDGLHRARRSRARPPRSPVSVRRVELEDPQAEIVAATDDLVIVARAQDLVAFSARDLAQRWRARVQAGPGQGALVKLCGDDVLVAREARLRLLDVATGVERGQAALGGHAVRLDAFGDRAHVALDASLAVLDVAARPVVTIWTQDTPDLVESGLAGAFVVQVTAYDDRAWIRALDAETGALVATFDCAALERRGVPKLLAYDARRLLVSVDDPPPDLLARPEGRPALAALLELPSLRPLWTTTDTSAWAPHVLADDLDVWPGRARLNALGTSDGARRWSVPVPTAVLGDPKVALSSGLAWTAGALEVSRTEHRGTGEPLYASGDERPVGARTLVAYDADRVDSTYRLGLLGHDVQTGALRFDVTLAPTCLEEVTSTLAPIDGGCWALSGGWLYLVTEAEPTRP